jgi:DNA mismatch repair protein MutS
VGASDNLARGESTFLVEMNETARILRAASEHSFIILDEIGRGTSTEDGRAIAWAVCEHLLDVVRAHTLFATHLRELTEIHHPHAANYSLQVEDEGREVVFLKRVEPGAADQSYGVHVAALAGVPGAVVTRARELLGELSGAQEGASMAFGMPAVGGAGGERDAAGQQDPAYSQGVLFSPHELVGRAVAALDVDATTPLAALQLLARWQRELREPER